MRVRFLFVAVVFLVACRDGAPPTVATDVAPSATTSSTTSSTTPAERTLPGRSCLMARVCGCNLGCTAVAVAPEGLRDGMSTTAQSGPLKGTVVKVLRDTDGAGASVFTVSDRERNSVCRSASEGAGLAYLCATASSGPVPAKACASGCD